MYHGQPQVVIMSCHNVDNSVLRFGRSWRLEPRLEVNSTIEFDRSFEAEIWQAPREPTIGVEAACFDLVTESAVYSAAAQAWTEVTRLIP